MSLPFDDNNKRMFYFLVALGAAAALGFQGWRTLYNNFAVEVVGVTGAQNGVIQGLREVPGFLAFVVIYVLLFIKEHHLAALSLLIMGLGVAAAGILDTYPGLILTTMVMSFGFHYYETVNQSLTVQHFSTTQVPLVLGRVRSVMSVSNIAVGTAVLAVSYLLEYWILFLLIGGLVALVALGCLIFDPTPKESVPQQKRLILRTRYWLFYALTFMAGARRQVFVAFAVFLLVKVFHFTIQEIAILFVFNNLVNYFLAPMVGRAINRFGERAVLSVEYSVLILVFLTYATADSKLIVAAAYVVDHIFFNCQIAIPSFFRKIAAPEEVAPSMAMGFTINHIVAVVIPILGGLVWMASPALVFIAGAALAVVSLALSQLVPWQIAKNR